MLCGVSSAQGQPSISLDRTTISQNTDVTVTGHDFTPGGTAHICITTGNVYGTGLCTGNPPTADSTGNFIYSFHVSENVPLGPQQVWAKDVARGINTSGVAVIVVAPPVTLTIVQFVTQTRTETTKEIVERTPEWVYWATPVAAVIAALITYIAMRNQKPREDVTKVF
jgi:hypothetical protein